MLKEKHITTREFLRNFRKYKNMLLGEKIRVLYIKIENGEELELCAEGKRGNAAEIVERFKALDKPIHIKRNPALFNSLLRPLPGR